MLGPHLNKLHTNSRARGNSGCFHGHVISRILSPQARRDARYLSGVPESESMSWDLGVRRPALPQNQPEHSPETTAASSSSQRSFPRAGRRERSKDPESTGSARLLCAPHILMASLYTHHRTPSSGSGPTQGALSDTLCPSLQAEGRPELWGTPNPAAPGVPEACQGPDAHGHPLRAGVGGVPQEAEAESGLHQCHRYRRPTSPLMAGRGCLLAGESRSHQKLRSP